MLFLGDEELKRLQRQSATGFDGVHLTEAEQRREYVEHARELREHARWRTFARLLFIWPFVVALVTAAVQWLVMKMLAPSVP